MPFDRLTDNGTEYSGVVFPEVIRYTRTLMVATRKL